MTLSWMMRRLRSMSFGEVQYRTRSFLAGKLQQAGYRQARPPTPKLEDTRPWTTPAAEGFIVPDYVRAAESIMQGRYSIFALKAADLGFPPDWNRDPKSGVVAPLAFGKFLNYRDRERVGNIKYLWELNRHQELVTLAQAWYLTREERFANACRSLLDDWLKCCPYPFGPNWSSSLELAIRLVNWSFAWQLLGGMSSPLFAASAGFEFRHAWLESIYRHCHFIAGHLSKYSSANNHLLGEYLGLFVANLSWPCWPESSAWLEMARNGFEAEALKQNFEDGVNKEQAVWYQHEVADMMILAATLGRRCGVEFNDKYWLRLERMLEFLGSIMDVAGNMPAIGDADDGVMVRFCPSRELNVFRSLLATGAALFRNASFKRKGQTFDEKSRWLLGDSAANDFEGISAQHARVPIKQAFEEGGYYVLGDNYETDDEVRVIADAGPLGYLSIAAHGHADALSCTLSVGGRPVLVDPGTYAYHTKREWREYFRGTAAHNTLELDNCSQSTTGGPFLWTRHANISDSSFSTHPLGQTLVASHDGYLRLKAPAVHRRSMSYSAATRTLLIEDEVDTDGAHMVAVRWHIDIACSVELELDCLRVSTDRHTVCITWSSDMTPKLRSGSMDPIDGWLSREFDVKLPAQVLVLRQQISGTWRGWSRIVVSNRG